MADTDSAKPILLHGVTGSGKTEIYLQAIKIALEQRKKCNRARAGNFAHAANGRAIQKSLLRNSGWRRGSAQSFVSRANGTMNGTRFIPAARGLLLGRAAPFSRRSKISDSSSSMRNTKLPTSRKKRRGITHAMSPSCAGKSRSVSCFSAAPRRRSKVITTPRPENTSSPH